jgi:hypothetical protein
VTPKKSVHQRDFHIAGTLRGLVVHPYARLCTLQRASRNLNLLKTASYYVSTGFLISQSEVRLLSPAPYVSVNYSFRSPLAIGKIAFG